MKKPGFLFAFMSLAGTLFDVRQHSRAAEGAEDKPMSSLSQHQSEALDAYEVLQRAHPELFRGRVVRPIVLNRDVLAAYAREHNVVLGVAVETPYVYFINDLVESRGENGAIARHPYLRVVSRGQLNGGKNVVVIATIENSELGEKGSVVFVTQERHALGESEIELPRGFGEAGLSGEANALKELAEETGYIGDHAYLLGSLYTDSGLTDSMVSFYHVPVLRIQAARPETKEAISKVSLASRAEIWKQVAAGHMRDNFTVTALSLYEVAQRGLAPGPKGVDSDRNDQ